LYNAALDERREAWRMNRVSVTYHMQSAQLPAIKEIRPEYNEIFLLAHYTWDMNYSIISSTMCIACSMSK
jgi:hypothetical protein